MMGVNVVLFLALQFIAEPWRRRRLVNGVVEREREVLDEVRRELGDVREALRGREVAAPGAVSQEVVAEERVSGAALSIPGVVALEEAILEGGRVDDAITPIASEGTDGAILEGVRAEDADPGITTTETPIPAPSWTWREFASDPARWKSALADLYSERRVDLTMRDASLLALEGAIAGGAVVAGIAVFWFKRA